MGSEVYVVAQGFKAFDELLPHPFRLQLIEMVCAQVLVGQFGVGEQMVKNDQQGVRYGDDGAVCSASSSQAVILGLEITILLPGRRTSGFTQRAAKPVIAMRGGRAFSLAGGLCPENLVRWT